MAGISPAIFFLIVNERWCVILMSPIGDES
jgi:hypothetical protein